MGTPTRKKIIQSCLIVIIFVISFIRPALYLFDHRMELLKRGFMEERYPLVRSLYYSSQYVKKVNPSIIPDHHLETFAAGAFLKGVNPILIVHDQPPLGRYILSLSIFLFDNPQTLVIGLLIVVLIGIFLIAKEVIFNIIASLIPVGIFANEPLFFSKFQYSTLLEPIQLPFIIFALYFFIRGVTGKRYLGWFVATSLMLGFAISIRFFILGAFLIFSMVIFLLITEKMNKKTLSFIFSLPIALIVLILSYTRTFLDGYSIIQVLGIQKYIFFYHQSKFTLPLTFWDLILFNRWHTWWGNMSITSDPHWIIAWPIAMILPYVYMVMALLRKISLTKAEKVIILWVISYSLMLSSGNSTTRYFLPLLPFLYIISMSFVMKLIQLLKSSKLK